MPSFYEKLGKVIQNWENGHRIFVNGKKYPQNFAVLCLTFDIFNYD